MCTKTSIGRLIVGGAMLLLATGKRQLKQL